jgi:hypothetical protein
MMPSGAMMPPSVKRHLSTLKRGHFYFGQTGHYHFGITSFLASADISEIRLMMDVLLEVYLGKFILALSS